MSVYTILSPLGGREGIGWFNASNGAYMFAPIDVGVPGCNTDGTSLILRALDTSTRSASLNQLSLGVRSPD